MQFAYMLAKKLSHRRLKKINGVAGASKQNECGAGEQLRQPSFAVGKSVNDPQKPVNSR